MMKYPHSRVALLLLALAAVAAGLSACGGAEARKTRAIARGDEYLADGKIDKARVEYRNALQIAPNDALTRFKNGVVQDRLGNVREAYQFYQGALSIDPDLTAARIELGRLEVFGAAPERALETVKPGLEKHPDDAGLLTVRAAARAGMKDSAGAIEDAERAHALDPKSENALAVLAGLYSSNGRVADARALLEAGVKQLPRSIDLKLALAQLYLAGNERALAEPLLHQAVEQEPKVAAHRVRLAQFFARGQQDAQAEQVLRDGVLALPDDRSIKLALLEFLGSKRGRPAEEQEFKRQLEARPDDAQLRFAFAQFYEQGADPAKAAAVLAEAVKREGTNANGLAARTRLARLDVLRNDVAAANALVGEVLAVSPRDPDALSLRGNLLLAKGDARGAIDDFRAVLRDQPNAVGVMRVLARAHVRNGEPALAEEVLRHAVEAAPADAGARLDLGELLLGARKVDAAKEVLAQLTRDHPDDLAAQEALFRAALAGRDGPVAQAALAALAKGHADTPKVKVLEGEFAEYQQHPQDALAAYEAALKLQPDGIEPLEAVTRILVASKRVPEALRRLDAAAEAAPKSAVPLSLKGDVLAAQRDFNASEAAYRAASARAPRWWTPYRGLANVLAQRDGHGAAEALLRDADARVDDPRPLRASLADYYQSNGEGERAEAIYEQMLKSDPADVVAANNLAMLLVAGHPSAQRLARAAELAKRFADSPNPQFLDTFGWVKVKQGDAQTGLAALERAAAQAQGSPTIRYHLGVAQLAAGRTRDGRDSLKRSLASGVHFEGSEDARAALAGASTGS